jgi:hypothetical protein
MKVVAVLIFLLFVSAMVFGQAAATQSAPPQAAPMEHPMRGEMMQHHMQEMKAQLDAMRAKIADIKANLAKVKDPAAKQALQADVDLWETMAGHMEAMQKMMPPPGHGPGMATQHEGGGCCAGMMNHGAKSGDNTMSCCGGNKCMQSKSGSPIAPETPAPPAN